MTLYESILALGDHLLECEVQLLAATYSNKLPDRAAADYCMSLAGTIKALPHLGEITREKASLGLANTFCPLHDKGIGDGLIADAMLVADRDGCHAKLLRLMRDIRLLLVVVEQTSNLEGILERALQELHPALQAESDVIRAGNALNQLIDEWTGHIGRGMKTVDVEAKVKYLLGLGVKPDEIRRRTAQEAEVTISTAPADYPTFTDALQAIQDAPSADAIKLIVGQIDRQYEAGTMEVSSDGWARLASLVLVEADRLQCTTAGAQIPCEELI